MPTTTPEPQPSGYWYRYPHPAVTTDCVIFALHDDRLRVLLIRRGRDPYRGKWAFPGGFLNPDECADEGALRELKEETGLEAAGLKQFHAFSKPDRDPRERVITIAYHALVRMADVHADDDADDARWFDIAHLPELAFDHDQVFAHAVRSLSEQLLLHPDELTNTSAAFTPNDLSIASQALSAINGQLLTAHS